MNNELELYHGSDATFTEFDAAYIKNSLYGWGHSFDIDINMAAECGKIIYTIELSNNANLLDFDDNDEFENIYEMFAKDIEEHGISRDFIDLENQQSFRDKFWSLQENYHKLLGLSDDDAMKKLTEFLKELGYDGTIYKGQIYTLFNNDCFRIKGVKKLEENVLNFGNIVNSILKESLSQSIYHFTYFINLYRMVEHDMINFSRVTKDSRDDNINSKYGCKKPYFLSCTRVKDGRFGYSQGFDVRIELNSDAFNSNFISKPISFFTGEQNGKSIKQIMIDRNNVEHKMVESEDRIFSSKPYLKHIERYIKRVDILIPLYPTYINNFKDIYPEKFKNVLELWNSKLKGKIFLYFDSKEFNRQGRDNNKEFINSLKQNKKGQHLS